MPGGGGNPRTVLRSTSPRPPAGGGPVPPRCSGPAGADELASRCPRSHASPGMIGSATPPAAHATSGDERHPAGTLSVVGSPVPSSPADARVAASLARAWVTQYPAAGEKDGQPGSVHTCSTTGHSTRVSGQVVVHRPARTCSRGPGRCNRWSGLPEPDVELGVGCLGQRDADHLTARRCRVCNHEAVVAGDDRRPSGDGAERDDALDAARKIRELLAGPDAGRGDADDGDRRGLGRCDGVGLRSPARSWPAVMSSDAVAVI